MKTSPRALPKRKTAASDTRAERGRTSSRNPARSGLWRKRLRARLTSGNERGLLQELHEGTARGALELLGVDRAAIVEISGLEAFLNEREKFIFIQSPVVVGVGRGEILAVEPAAQFASVEGSVVIAVKLVE